MILVEIGEAYVRLYTHDNARIISRQQHSSDVNYTWIPLVIAGVIAYLIAACFFGVYEVSMAHCAS